MAVNNEQLINNMATLISQNEAFMAMWKELAVSVSMEAQDPSFSRFSQAMIAVARDEIKPQFGNIKAAFKPEVNPKATRAGRGPVDNTWREEQRSLFTGRGAKWIYVDIDLVKAIATEDDSDIMACFEAQGKAWVHYYGARIINGVQMAAFEFRNKGSKYGAPNNLVYLPHDEIMLNEFERLEDGRTPYSLGIEMEKANVHDEDDEADDDTGVVIQLDQGGEAITTEAPVHDEDEAEDDIDLDIF